MSALAPHELRGPVRECTGASLKSWPLRRIALGLIEILAPVHERNGALSESWALCRIALGPQRTHGPCAGLHWGLYEIMAPMQSLNNQPGIQAMSAAVMPSTCVGLRRALNIPTIAGSCGALGTTRPPATNPKSQRNHDGLHSKFVAAYGGCCAILPGVTTIAHRVRVINCLGFLLVNSRSSREVHSRIQVYRHSRSGAASSNTRARVYFTFGPYRIVGTPLAASFFPKPGGTSDVSLPSGTSMYRRWAFADRCLPTSPVKWIVL